MPRYFFNVIEGRSKNLIGDTEGVVLRGAGEARKEALGLARDIAKHGFSRAIQTWRVVVTCETGDEILSVRLSDLHASIIEVWLDRSRTICRSLNSHLPLLLITALLALIALAAVTTRRVEENNVRYKVASAPAQRDLVDVRFRTSANAAEMTNLLENYKGSLVDGPRLGGFYRMRISQMGLQGKSIETIAGEIAKENIIEFVAVVE